MMMSEQEVSERYGKIKMDIIYGRLSAKHMRLFVHSMITNLKDAKMQPPLIEELALATDQEVKDHAIKIISDMGF